MSSENWQSLTVIEAIDAAERKSSSSLVIIQEKYLMTDWFFSEMNLNAIIITSESDFTNNAIEIEFLKHFIKHTDDAESHSEWKLLLINNHESHETAEFLKLTNDNHILSYSLLSHLTYCMQSLDVDVFQPYKHWHDRAIQNALADLSFEYNIQFFLSDLSIIQMNVFKKRTIQHAFKKSEIWSINIKQCLKQLKNFSSSHKFKESILSLLSWTSMNVEQNLKR